MSFSKSIEKKPLILVFILMVFLGFILVMIGLSNFKLLVPIISYSVIGFLIIFSGVATILLYNKYERPYDLLIVPLFVSISFICLTGLFMILDFFIDPTSLTDLTSKVNNLSFPLALFGVGISLYYFVEAQFSSDKKIDDIIIEIKKSKETDEIPPRPEQNKIETSPQIKNESTISEEDKLIMQHLFERHRTSLSSGDAIDLKLAQMIALNGLILSFILIKSPEVKSITIFVLGIGFLVCSIIIGVLGYRSTDWCAGANCNFFKDCGCKFSSMEGIWKLKDMLSDDIQENKEILCRKSEFFNLMLYFNILGIIIVIIGYYV